MSAFRVAMLTTLFLLLPVENEASPQAVWPLIRDVLQYNIAGLPVIHEKTEWTFDPEVGKMRRIRYEEENGKHGKIAIAKLGMGIGYKEPWGTPAKSGKISR